MKSGRHVCNELAEFEAQERWEIRRQQDEDFLKRNRRMNTKWEVEVKTQKFFRDDAVITQKVCFPAGFDRSDLVECTVIGKLWATFINTKTGVIIDCADFAKQMETEAHER